MRNRKHSESASPTMASHNADLAFTAGYRLRQLVVQQLQILDKLNADPVGGYDPAACRGRLRLAFLYAELARRIPPGKTNLRNLSNEEVFSVIRLRVRWSALHGGDRYLYRATFGTEFDTDIPRYLEQFCT